MNKLKLITLLCLLIQGCSTTEQTANTPINDLDSIILAPQQDQVFDNSDSQMIDPNVVIQDKASSTPPPILDEVNPVRTYWF